MGAAKCVHNAINSGIKLSLVFFEVKVHRSVPALKKACPKTGKGNRALVRTAKAKGVRNQGRGLPHAVLSQKGAVGESLDLGQRARRNRTRVRLE